MNCLSYNIKIDGTVQGVGFRPFIYTLAIRYNLNGTVSNGSNGVEIFINSTPKILKLFISSIKNELPPLASINSISIKEVSFIEFNNFKIIRSQNRDSISVNIPPDISICKECEEELFNPNNRRYNYPFINCTNCGVRYSIIYDLPYDRENTAMREFSMCQDCKKEYNNPLDRRYHAQPIGCFKCGVQLKDKIKDIVKFIDDGKILAIKGVGGYHFVCDASNHIAINRLREKKGRATKPFAIMVKDINMAHEMAYINLKEEELLTSKERPIVLLNSKNIDSAISPNSSRIGIFIAYTPLHILILKELNSPIVATSANITDEPIATKTKDIEKLSNIYDYLIDHDRDIVNGCDDSVVMVIKNQTIFIRRARGYTPVSIKLPFKLKGKILAVGANQKNTIAIAFKDKAIISPHIGDLDAIKSIEYFKDSINNLKRIYQFEPNEVVCDIHPNYESTKYAKSLNIRVKEVQHHYAHIIGVMAEKNLSKEVLGVSFDGTGLGDDGKLWGGEFLISNYNEYKRVAHFKYFKLLGGARAIKEPKRVALSLLFDSFGDKTLELDNPTTRAFSESEIKTQYLMWKKGLNSPFSSSVGRIFDAIASIVGICQVISFEGESGMRMEEFYNKNITNWYPFQIQENIINIEPLIKEIVQESNIEIAISKFFNTLVEIIYVIYKRYNLPLVLSGGVFQNRILLELVLNKIPTAIIPNKIPINDGGIAFGQIISATREL